MKSRLSRRDFLQTAAALALTSGCGRSAGPSLGSGGLERMIVLGVDGMDPGLLRRFIAEGRMPNCARLLQSGSFQPLATSNPPQSPVAWSNFISGTNPGGARNFRFYRPRPGHDAAVPCDDAARAGWQPVAAGAERDSVVGGEHPEPPPGADVLG